MEGVPFTKLKLKNRKGKTQIVHIHSYLVGTLYAAKIKKDNKFHSLFIVTGSVGSGKSTLIQACAALDAHFNNTKFDMDNISWATEKFIEKTDRDDNYGEPQMWDEAIQGASARSMAISAVGNKLKNAFVTKRTKRHTYFLLLDEIKEYSPKLIGMADAWINVRTFGIKRGYFDIYVHKYKINFLFQAFKYYNKNWYSKVVKQIKPDSKGMFDDYSDIFISEEEYEKNKIEETKQIDKEDKNSKVAQIERMLSMGLAQNLIAEAVGCTPQYVSTINKKSSNKQI